MGLSRESVVVLAISVADPGNTLALGNLYCSVSLLWNWSWRGWRVVGEVTAGVWLCQVWDCLSRFTKDFNVPFLFFKKLLLLCNISTYIRILCACMVPCYRGFWCGDDKNKNDFSDSLGLFYSVELEEALYCETDRIWGVSVCDRDGQRFLPINFSF